jgi:molecular chaperone HscB
MASSKLQPAIPVLPNGEAATAACWSCGDMRAAHFCNSCGSVQPPMPTDYFSFFGVARKLNLDTAALERAMHQLSRRLHPDVYARATDQEQEWSLEQTSKLNDAYRTLRDPVLRTEYLLRIEGVRTTERKGEGLTAQKQAVPPELLEEVFELNMQLEEFRTTPGRAKTARPGDPDQGGDHDRGLHRELEEAQRNFEQKLEAIGSELKRCWDEWDALMAREIGGEAVAHEERRRLLHNMVNILHRRRYVDHLVREIATALAG